jgi:hypothetical protein
MIQPPIKVVVNVLCLATDELFIQSIPVSKVLVIFCSAFLLPALIDAVRVF